MGSLVGTFNVVDEDKQDFHFCYLMNPDSLFRVDGIQLFVKRPLTNATSSRHPIYVFCSDSRLVSVPTVLYVEVRSNLLLSQVNISLNSTQIKENEPAGSVVGRVTARTSNANDSLLLQLDDDSNGTFAMVTRSAVNAKDLVTTRSLDYELENQYRVVIRVYGSGGATNFQMFTIQVRRLHTKKNSNGELMQRHSGLFYSNS